MIPDFVEDILKEGEELEQKILRDARLGWRAEYMQIPCNIPEKEENSNLLLKEGDQLPWPVMKIKRYKGIGKLPSGDILYIRTNDQE